MSGLKTKILATAFAFSPFAAAAQEMLPSENESNTTGIEVTETPRTAEVDGRTIDFESALLAQQGREVLYQVAGLSDGSALYKGHADPSRAAYGTDQPFIYVYQNPNGEQYDITDVLPTTIQGGPNVKMFKDSEEIGKRMRKAGFGQEDVLRITAVTRAYGMAQERVNKMEQDAAYYGYDNGHDRTRRISEQRKREQDDAYYGYGKTRIDVSGGRIRIGGGVRVGNNTGVTGDIQIGRNGVKVNGNVNSHGSRIIRTARSRTR